MVVKRTDLIAIGLASILAGLFISKFTDPISLSWLVLAIIATIFGIRKGPTRLIIIIFVCLIIGWWRGGVLQKQDIKFDTYFDKKITLVGRATEDSFYSSKSQLEVTVEKLQINGENLPGKVRLRGYGEAMIYRHDIVEATGKLTPTLGGKQASMSFADLNVIARASSPLEDFRRNFIAGMETALPEPAASFGIGLLVGQRSLMPDDVALILTLAGLTHIVAVSGYNLTIIVNGVKRALSKLSRFQILISTLALIYLFLLVTGFSPSIIRAAIVSFLGLTAWYFGRKVRPIILILITAVITGFINPYFVWGDIGWYLSFMAFFGVLVLAPLLTLRIFGNKNILFVGSVAIESFAAQIAVFPIIALIFTRVSVVGFVSNIIIVPMVPFAMLFSLIAGLAGMFVPAISGWIALPARILLNLMLALTKWFASWPFSTVKIGVSILGLVLFYLILAIFIVGLKKKSVSVIIEQRRIKKASEV